MDMSGAAASETILEENRAKTQQVLQVTALCALAPSTLNSRTDQDFIPQEIRFVQMELEELVMQAELESLCSAVECMIQKSV